MNFLNPLFLFGLAAAAIPIVIHLFTRKRPREVPFSSLEFLSEVNRSEIRRIQIKQWLLLLLRTLAVAALAMAIARPVLRAGAAARQGAATTAVVLVDQSGSMGSTNRSGTLLEEARRTIESLLATLGPGDEMLLVPYDEAPRPLSPRPLSDLPRLRAAVQALRPGARCTDHAQALAFAARALGESRSLNRELFWISDFQAAGFTTAEGEVAPTGFKAPSGPWDQVRTYLVPLAPTPRPNAAVVDAGLAPAEQGAAIAVTGRALGISAGDRAVTVRALPGGDELGRGFLPLPEQGDAAALIPLARMPDLGGEVMIPDDALALDNRRVFAAGRSGTLRVLLREDGDPSPLRVALQAGAPASGLMTDVADGATLPARIDDADAVVINDVERLGPTELQAVLDYVRGGGSLLLVLGRHADAAFWNGALLTELGAGRLADLESAPAGGAWRLRRRVPGHPVLVGFAARPGEALSNARFQAVRGFAPTTVSRTLLEFDRQHPALVEAGHCLLFLAPLDIQASDFPVSGAFLPLFHQIVKVMGRGTASPSLVPGERYGAPAGTGTWRIEDEAGRQVAVELVAAEGATRLVSAPLELPGLYRVLQGGQVRASFAVNPDPRESELASLPNAALVRGFPPGRATLLQPGTEVGRRVRESRYGVELWPWFVALALALLVSETVIGRWGMAGVEGAAPK